MVVFVSHASEQAQLAEKISIALRQSQHRVFFDREALPPAGDYQARIREAVDHSDWFVFLISPESLSENSFALTELEIAQRKWPNPAGHVLPVMASPTELSVIPEYLKAVTILEPRGDIAEATRRAIDEWSALEELDLVETVREHFADSGALELVTLSAKTFSFQLEVLERGQPNKSYKRTIRGIIKGQGENARFVDEPTEYHATAGREYDDGSGATCRDVTLGHQNGTRWMSRTTTYRLHRGRWVSVIK